MLIVASTIWAQDPQARFLGIASAIAVVGILSARYRGWRREPFEYASGKWARTERDRLRIRRSEQRDTLLDLSPRDFETATARLFEKMGFEVRQTRQSSDGGWDVELVRGSERILVECKRYNPDRAVGRPALQKLHSAAITEGASGAIAVTTGRFSRHAQEFAQTVGIRLVDGEALGRQLLDIYGSGQGRDVAFGMCTSCGRLTDFSPEIRPDHPPRECADGHIVHQPFSGVQ